MEYIYIADQIKNDDGSPKMKIGEEIKQTDLNDINSAFSFCVIYHSVTQIRDIVVENGIDFQRYMDPQNLQRLRNQIQDPEKLVLNANKLSLNYATSIKTYIDMETRVLKKFKSEAELFSFQKMCSMLYDDHKEYRFWMNFRNYVVHCELPYCKFSEAIGQNCKVVCTKEHLLKFDNWKHSKIDILSMEDEIDLPGMVNEMSGMIMMLYLDFFAYFGEQITKAINKYSEFCRKHSVSNPVIIKTCKARDFSEGYIQPFPVSDLKAAYENLKRHPHVTINLKDAR